MKMKLPTRDGALALRDGGIDAMAALDHAFERTLDRAHEEPHTELKLAVGHAMPAVMDAALRPAIDAFPEIAPSEDAWRATVRERLTERLGALYP